MESKPVLAVTLFVFVAFLFFAWETFNYKENYDYHLDLHPSGKIRVLDSDRNEFYIQPDSLEEYIIKDNL
jgi:hypothetical protein